MATLAGAGSQLPDPLLVASRELELSAAKKPDIYLVLSPERRVLDVRARGVTLDRVPLSGIELVSQQRIIGRRLPSAPAVPARWVVKEGPGDLDREVIAPEVLRPMPKEGEEESSSAPGATAPTPTPTAHPEPPVSYRVQLENGWDLWITDQPPPQGLFHLLVAAFKDGWRRWRGLGVDLAPAVTLIMAPDDARRLHHLFRTGATIIVAVGGE